MTKPTPYSYVTTGGVSNTRVKTSNAAATLADLHATPVTQLTTTSREYHTADKKTKTSIKKTLPYFVGGVIDGKRDDANVRSRTLLTLDVEQGPHDEPPPSPESVVEKLRNLGGAGWVYTSLSHTAEAPRYRVVLPIGSPLGAESTAALQASTQAAAKKLGIAEWTQPESWRLSQAMYLPAKLRGGEYYSALVEGKSWKAVTAPAPAKAIDKKIADIPDAKVDPVLHAIKAAGLYLRENPRHPGMHFITCPFIDQHEAENDTQTVYYEAHFDGNPRAAVKCFDTAPDHDGQHHLTYASLVASLRERGHLASDAALDQTPLDEYSVFDTKSHLGTVLSTEPVKREWVVEQFAPCGKVTVLAGPGGVSKSMLMLQLLLYASLGVRWAEFQVATPVRSLYVSYEDDRQELHGRVHTLTRALRDQDSGAFDVLYDVNSTVQQNVRMFAADDEAASWLLLTKPDRYGQPVRGERVEWLIGYIKERGIKLLVLDPAVYTHQLEENDIAAMATYMQTLTYIAKQGGCAVVVLHHMNKTGGWAQLDDINQGSLRGASSFADNARSVAVVVSMPIKDAEAWGLPATHETTGRYAVVKHVKHNYSAPLPTMVFERKGALLIPRPDITRLDKAVLEEVRERSKQQEATSRINTWVPRVLTALREYSGPVSQNQISLKLGTKTSTMKAVLEYCHVQDFVDITDGPNRSRLHELTQNGRNFLKLASKEVEE